MITIDEFNTIRWYNKQDQLHREDGPAVEHANGGKSWYRNGQCHREDGPAVECADGDKYWYRNGQFHREDGPAVEYADGRKSWYINGKSINSCLFSKIVRCWWISKKLLRR